MVAWRDIGIDNAFTLETSFAGTGDNREQKNKKKDCKEQGEDAGGTNKLPKGGDGLGNIHYHFGIDHLENIGIGLCKALLHYCRIGVEGEKLKNVTENNFVRERVEEGSAGGGDFEYEADDERALNISNHRSTRRPINRRRPQIIRPVLARQLKAPVVLSERVAIHQAKHCERARAELDVRKYLYVRQRQELKILRAKIEAAEASNTKKSKAAKQKHEANLALLEQELTVSSELKGEGETACSVFELINIDEEEAIDSDLLEAGIDDESLGSDSDPSGDNVPPNVLLKDKEFQKFVQRSTVAPQLAHMELNSGRRAMHKKSSKLAKSRRKKKSCGGGRLAAAAAKVMKMNREKKERETKEKKEMERERRAQADLTTSDLLQPRQILPKAAPVRTALSMTTVQMTRKGSAVPGASDVTNVRGVNVRRVSATIAQKYVNADESGPNSVSNRRVSDDSAMASPVVPLPASRNRRRR